MGGLRFGIDGDGNYGYYGADDSLIPFSNGAFSGVVAVNRCGNYLGCVMDSEKINKLKYVKYQTTGGEAERYLYVYNDGSTTTTLVEATALGDNTYEYTCADNQTFGFKDDFENNTVMIRTTGANVGFKMCQFLPSKPA